ncbi:endolytic transglycosylase MltG [Bacillus sp. BGMRC 2118]|nr:endolytic transglycosylase MltG [Bacillus sp. BGMRC 2118]
MTKGFMRGLSLGIIITCLLVFIIDNPFSEDNKTIVEKEIPLTDQTIQQTLKERGQTVIATEELNRLKQIEQEQAKANTETVKETEETQPAEDSEQPKEDAPLLYTLEVKSGMASTDISNKLAEVKIINNADDLEKYLQEKDWAKKIQIGTFEVSNKMSIDEIARTITKQ